MGQMKPSTTEATNASPSNIIFQLAIMPNTMLIDIRKNRMIFFETGQRSEEVLSGLFALYCEN